MSEQQERVLEALANAKGRGEWELGQMPSSWFVFPNSGLHEGGSCSQDLPRSSSFSAHRSWGVWTVLDSDWGLKMKPRL